jgi:hypothetical protein
MLAGLWSVSGKVDTPELKTVIPERLIGCARRRRSIVDLDEVVLCADRSDSMASSVIYAYSFAAVMASFPVVTTRLVCFDTATDQLANPVMYCLAYN